jgi:putative membrane protein
MMRLMQLSGAEFDRAYMNEAGVNSHLEAAAVYQRQVALGVDPDLKAFASRTLPRVQGHLAMASQMVGYRFAQNNSLPGMNMPNLAKPQSTPPLSGMDRPNLNIPPMSR